MHSLLRVSIALSATPLNVQRQQEVPQTDLGTINNKWQTGAQCGGGGVRLYPSDLHDD